MDQETKVDSRVFDVAPSTRSGLTRTDLIRQYKAMCRAGAIYYPVAYHFARELGRGRQGIVYESLRQGARGCITRHAIKVFDPSIYPSAKAYWTDMGRIAVQTSRMQMVRNANLVARDIYEETNGIGYLQMELINGCTVRHLLGKKHLELMKGRCTKAEWNHYTDVLFRIDGDQHSIQPGIALFIMRQILRGVESLHTAGFVHSDIKPANVMIDTLGQVRVVDYGRAVMAQEYVSFLLGSPVYMAPEQHRKEPAAIQSDLYSIGLVGLEMLMGRPFVDPSNMNEQQLLEFKLTLPDRLSELLPDHVLRNVELVGMLMRFIDPAPENRFPNAGTAESKKEGLALVHRQLTQTGQDTDWDRELAEYLGKLLAPPEDPIQVLEGVRTTPRIDRD